MGKLSERIREAAVGYGTEEEPDAGLIALAAEVAELEKRAVPSGWIPTGFRWYEDGVLLSEVSEVEYSSAGKFGWSVGAAKRYGLSDGWQSAIAAAEAAAKGTPRHEKPRV